MNKLCNQYFSVPYLHFYQCSYSIVDLFMLCNFFYTKHVWIFLWFVIINQEERLNQIGKLLMWSLQISNHWACWGKTAWTLRKTVHYFLTKMGSNISFTFPLKRCTISSIILPYNIIFGGHKSFLWGYWYSSFGLVVISALDFKDIVDPSFVFFITCLKFLRFTSGVKSAGLLVTSMVAKPSWPTFSQTYPQVLMGLKSTIECVTAQGS